MKLSQVLAVEKNVKANEQRVVTDIYHALKRTGVTDGFIKIYTPNDDEGEQLEPQKKTIQLNTKEALREASEAFRELFDVVATKEWGNYNNATAPLIVDGEKLIDEAPATFYLYLEKRLKDIRALIEAVPTLDPSEQWEWDEENGIFRSHKTVTDRTKKVQKPIVLYPATEQHPAQTQLVSEDVSVGKWTTEKLSSALPPSEKKGLLRRCDKLIRAVKQAREEANSVTVESKEVGEAIVNYIFDL